MRIIELKTPLDSDIHGTRARSPHNQIKRRIGAYQTVAIGLFEEGPSGTVRDKDGKCWDWWMDNGEVIILPAK